ncbi:hypothetical protein SDC9_173488 [bioreactor metagenome]|uniref:Uncharacterized protein n=1 Tax=bioreactor metagenome TaxID=1076179 RepID=A0A645GIL5_9ZZZZ
MIMNETSSHWLNWSGWLCYTGYLSPTAQVFCPAAEVAPLYSSGVTENNARERWSVTQMRVFKSAYTENFKGCYKGNYNGTWAPSWGDVTDQRCINFKRVSMPTEFFLLGDLTPSSGASSGVSHARWFWHSSHSFWRIHNKNNVNMLFADGHVAAWTIPQIKLLIHPDAMFL